MKLSNADNDENDALLRQLAGGFNPRSDPAKQTSQQPLAVLDAELAEMISTLRKDRAASARTMLSDLPLAAPLIAD